MKRAAVPSILVVVVLLALGVTAEAQQAKKIYRLGFLSNRAEIGPNEEAFRRGLRELGYAEGENLVIEWRFVSGQLDRHPEVAAELVRLKVDCIVASGLSASRAAKQSTSTIPIVMTNVSDDPVRNKLIDSLARPGGNITGFTDVAPDLAGKRLELLKETLPKASRVAVLWYSASSVAATQLKETEIAARPLKVQIQSLDVRRSEDLDQAFQIARKQASQALIVVSFGGLIVDNKERVVNLANKNRLPAMYTTSEFVEAGGLMSYAPDGPDRVRRAAGYVDKILKGTKPADLPVQQPMKFELVINLKTAKQIDLTIPQSMLYRADKVIK
jgi:putative tryptophan/tyrosine transport system substrate-binding protein